MGYPTYKDLCINVLLRMGEDKNINNGEITQTTAITGYLKTMPDLLSEALEILSTAGKYIISELEIVKEADGYERFDLKALAPDFYSLDGRRVYRNDEKSMDYTLEGGRYFAVSKDGIYRLYYNSYPQEILRTISDGTELLLDPEVYAILPLYIEGKLRQINDEDYAMSVLSEFEQRRAELMGRNSNKGLQFGTVTVSNFSRAVELW